MTIIMPTTSLPPALTLRDGYLDNLSVLGLTPRAMRDRARIADAFLGHHPDLVEWMKLPALSRCEELARTGAWPVIVYALAHNGLLLDLELIGAKNLTGIGAAIQTRDPDGFAQMRAAGNRLGWTSKWVETLLGQGLAVLLAWTGGTTTQLTTDIIDTFETGLVATTTLTPSMLRAYRARLAGLRAILFDTKITDTPPRRRPTASSYEERFAAVEMAPSLRGTFGPPAFVVVEPQPRVSSEADSAATTVARAESRARLRILGRQCTRERPACTASPLPSRTTPGPVRTKCGGARRPRSSGRIPIGANRLYVPGAAPSGLRRALLP